ncbi:NAD(P)/FAD-dependent oxidoreductase [Streptomyces sviceus]|uniref:NAD(P)/FAD-dependent oxidoreductase n=1 Tax=Streptomyces sviceus TaxID=285530 RepID=UPI0036E7CDED
MTAPHRVLVVGGGPAGSVTATLLAQEGFDVRLLESSHFPRYHIGESLTPSTRRVLQLVGVADQLDAGGFQVKRGGAFRWGDDSWVIDWSEQFGDEMRTWQVDRAAFDALLLDNARKKGVEVQHGIAAKSVTFDTDGRPTAVHCVNEEGTTLTVEGFDYLIDASGRAGLLSTQHFRNRQQHQFFRNVAIWSYWNDARLLPDSPEGGVNVISSPKGWYWVIPLDGGRTSIGLVTHKDTFARDRRAHTDLDTLYRELIADSPIVSDLVADATCVAPARVETDYSYVADRFAGPGYMMIGDAACFLDPLLSTGVHLALYGGLVGAASLVAMRDGQVSEADGLRFFEHAYRRAYTRALALVSSMYENYNGKDDFFWTADRLVKDEAGTERGERDTAAFGEIIAGLSDIREVTETTTRVASGRLTQEARRVEAAVGSSEPAFGTLRQGPQGDDPLLGLQVVTEPRLGLSRVTGSA